MAGSLGHYWMDRGLLSEMRTWLERSLRVGRQGQSPPVGPDSPLRGGLRTRPIRGSPQGEPRTLEEARSMGDLASVQRAMAHLANALEAEGFVEESWNLERESAEIARTLQDEHPRMLLVVAGQSGVLGHRPWDARGRRPATRRKPSRSLSRLDESADGAAARCNLALGSHRAGTHRGCRRHGSPSTRGGDRGVRSHARDRTAWKSWPLSRHDWITTALAARLLGASEALRERTGSELEPLERALHDRTSQLLRHALSDSELRAASAEGAEMDLRDAWREADRRSS